MDKKQQAKLLTEIMEADARDGLYSDISKMETTQTDGNKMKSTQTAVEFLLAELDIAKLIEREKLTMAAEVVRQAKQMEKDHIAQAYESGWVNGSLKIAPRFGVDYYNKIYNYGKQNSDDSSNRVP